MTQVDTYIRIKARQPAETPAGWVPKPRPAEGAPPQNGLMPFFEGGFAPFEIWCPSG